MFFSIFFFFLWLGIDPKNGIIAILEITGLELRLELRSLNFLSEHHEVNYLLRAY